MPQNEAVKPHASENLLRELFRALTEHNLATLQLLVAPNVVCHLQGSLETQGFERAWTLWVELTQRSANKLELALSDVLVGHHHASIVGAVSLQGDYTFVGQLVLLARLDKGQIVESWLFTDVPIHANATESQPRGLSDAAARTMNQVKLS